MVDEPEARRIAEEWIGRLPVEEDVIVDESQTIEEMRLLMSSSNL